jgi:arylformamidase
MTSFIDLSHAIEPGMTVFPGDPQPSFQPAAGVTAPWQVTDLRLGTHTGTHIDSASHYLPQGRTIDQYPLARLLLLGMVVPVPGLSDDQPITAEIISTQLKDFPEGGAVVIQTEWDQFWNTDRYLRHPYLSAEAALVLIEARVSLLGIDALNVDSTVQSTETVHRLLMEHDILIAENLVGLSGLQPGKLYQFSFLPLKLAGLDGSPVRAVAW